MAAQVVLAASLQLLTVSLALRIEDVQCPAVCQTDLDCSLNGQCLQSSGRCACSPSWTGNCCQTLNLEKASLHAHGYHHNATSTWGGNIILGEDGQYHMWIAEMAPNGTAGDPGHGSCGLTTWSAASQIVHVTSPSMTGPYQRQEVAVGIWSHNPLVRKMPDGTYVLYHIGSGSAGPSPGTVPPSGYCAANGTSPCGEQSFDQCANGTQGCAMAGAVPGYKCYDGFCSGDSSEDVNCGADIAEPALNCPWSDWAACVKAASEACNTTQGCRSFGMSTSWNSGGQAKLFSASSSGLVPNPQWTMWVAEGTEPVIHWPLSDEDMYARSRAAGKGVWPPATDIASPDGSCTLAMHTAQSVQGPWAPYANATIIPCGGNNPAPWVHPNGTVYLVVTDNNMGLYSAPSWSGPYTLVTRGACGGGEDPSLWIDPDTGAFHCMFHRSPFSNPDIAIGHAYSQDGFTWYVAADPAANSTISYGSGLGSVVHGKRERPHPYFVRDPGTGKTNIAAFVSGVCIIPDCNPLEGGQITPGADCTSGTQYHHCDANSPGPGWYDRTYTLVQAVQTG